MATPNEAHRWTAVAFGAPLAVVLLFAGSSCTSTTDESGAEVDGGERLTSTLYPAAMNEICAAATERLGDLPTPPDEIGQADWAGEVSMILRDEAAAFDELSVGENLRENHGSLIANTEELSAQWAEVREALSAGSDSIGDISSEIAELTLGREDLAVDMGLDRCGARGSDG